MPPLKKGKAEKTATIAELTRLLRDSSMLLVTEYRGVGTADLRRLRQALRPLGTTYHVTKNTLLRRAADDAGVEAIKPALTGPTAIAFVNGDMAEPIKALNDFVRTTRNVMVVKGGVLNNQLLSKDDVTAIAELPPRETLIAQVVGGFQAPIANLVYTLNNPIQALAYTLQARVDQLGEAA